jgi:predicted tellurium resistance membrane protein TerC
MEAFLNADALIALVTLTAMEIVLGIDNIIFIAILVARVPEDRRDKIRSIGIFLALFMRLGLLFSLAWVMRLTEPLFTVFSNEISGRDLILILGGLFLIGKSTFEIHAKVEDTHGEHIPGAAKSANVGFLLGQIIILDIVFSLDSVITAIGMVQNISIMVVAMVISMVVMLLASGGISRFVERHPTIKILALAFLILIGVMLLFEGMGGHMNKGYIYFAMFFSLLVELLNMRYRTKRARKLQT